MNNCEHTSISSLTPTKGKPTSAKSSPQPVDVQIFTPGLYRTSCESLRKPCPFEVYWPPLRLNQNAVAAAAPENLRCEESPPADFPATACSRIRLTRYTQVTIQPGLYVARLTRSTSLSPTLPLSTSREGTAAHDAREDAIPEVEVPPPAARAGRERPLCHVWRAGSAPARGLHPPHRRRDGAQAVAVRPAAGGVRGRDRTCGP